MRPDSGKCLHYYFYFIDAELGLVYLRVPTWAPFRLQFYCNGHSWLARRLTAEGIGFTAADNAFIRIDDWQRAQDLADRLSPDRLHLVLDRYAAQCCPVLDVFRQSYHWSLMQVEYSTDLMFRSEQTLKPLYEQLSRQAVLAVKAEQVANFLGKELKDDPVYQERLAKAPGRLPPFVWWSLYLLAVVYVGVRHGTGPAVAASISAVLLFDFLFIAPYFRFSVNDTVGQRTLEKGFVEAGAIAMGMDAYHRRHGVVVEELRVNVPISLRGDAGDRSGQASNAVSIKLHESLGFTHCGTIAQAGFKFGRWVDSVLIKLAPETFAMASRLAVSAPRSTSWPRARSLSATTACQPALRL